MNFVFSPIVGAALCVCHDKNNHNKKQGEGKIAKANLT